jgi:D-glycero-D-manno-heptose 1,7-bisphosphate phosphatase
VKPAVFLDRDGTLIVDEKYPHDPKLVRELPGAIAACNRLAQDFSLVVVSNQSGVARGLVSPTEAAAVHSKFLSVFSRIRFTDVRYCFHGPDDGCACRKPAPGMLIAAATEHGLDLKRSILIGDKPSDVEAGTRAGVRRSIQLFDWELALRGCYE